MIPEFRGIVVAGQNRHDPENTAVSVIFPRSAGLDLDSAMDCLFEVFPDQEPTLLSEHEDHWRFRLNWTSDSRVFVDPGVPSAAESIFGTSLPELGGYREVHRWNERDVVISMVHSWALLAPAKSIARRGKIPLSWIVHLDDHTDLMASLLSPGTRPGSLQDGIFDEKVDLGSPESVVLAIERGALNKGNFLTAYLLAHQDSRIVHVGRNLAEQGFHLDPRIEPIKLGGRKFTRSNFFLRPSSNSDWTFQQTRTLPTELPLEETEGIWLDIDLDYFLNRYDGDSDRRLKLATRNERREVMHRVEGFLSNLHYASWIPKIEAVSVAMSPGFFPSEYWADVITALRGEIRTLRRV